MRRSASEVIRELEGRIARLEKSAYKYNPNDLFEIEKGNGYIRFYLGGKFNTRTILKEIDSTFFKAFEYEFTYENGLPTDEYVIEECIAEAFDNTEIIEELSRVRKGEKAIQVNLYKKDEFVKNVVKELEGEMKDLEKNGVEYILEWAKSYTADKAFKAGLKALMEKYEDVRTNRINPKTYRLASTRKVAGSGAENARYLNNLPSRKKNNILTQIADHYGVSVLEIEEELTDPDAEELFEYAAFNNGMAMEIYRNFDRMSRMATSKVAGHIVLAGSVNVRQLTRDLEDTFGVEDIELEDGVLTFLMSSMDNKKIEKQIKALAKKHDVKFEKGEFTDGLGMIYTKKATRRTAAKLLKRHIKVLEKNKSRIKGIMFYDQLPQDIIRDLERVKWTETLHMDVERWLGDNVSGLRSRWASRRNR